jgi:hypothetical protein
MNRNIRSEYTANESMIRTVPAWQKPAPVRTVKTVSLFSRIINSIKG